MNEIRRFSSWSENGVEVLAGRFSGPLDSPDPQPTYNVWVLREGLNVVRAGGERHVLAPDGAVQFNPGERVVTERRLTPHTDDLLVRIAAATWERAADEVRGLSGDEPALATFRVADPAVRRLVVGLGQALAAGSDLHLAETTTELVHRLLVAEGGVPERRYFRERARLARARRLIEDRLAESVRLTELEDVTGLSRFYLLRTFKMEYGLPPHAFQTRLRLARARELLLRGMPVKAVALEVGFSDQSHFYRHFKRAYGLTPGAFLRGVS